MSRPTRVERPQPEVDYLQSLRGVPVSEPNKPLKPEILNQNKKALQTKVDRAKTKSAREKALQELNEFVTAESKYDRQMTFYNRQLRKYNNAIEAHRGMSEAYTGYEQKVREYEDFLAKKRKYKDYERELGKYSKLKAVLDRHFTRPIVSPHFFINDPLREDPVYNRAQPDYYVYYKKGGKIQKGKNGLPKIDSKAIMDQSWEEFNVPISIPTSSGVK